jgi:dTDP-4-dehydrorhamnose 3,5-epimerase
MTMNLIVPFGQVKFVFCNVQSQSEVFRIEEIGDHNYARLTVPPGIWFGFQGLKVNASLVLNIADIPHDPCEVRRLSEPEINYNWS